MANTLARQQNIKYGVLCGVLSAFSFALMSVFVKKIGTDFSTAQLIFFRFATSLVLLLPWLFIDKTFQFKVQQPLQYSIRIIAALLALYAVFYVIRFIPLVDTLLLNNTAPLFVPLLAFLLTGAKTPKKALIGIIIGFFGVGIILNPGQEILSWYSLIALASGFLAAVAILEMRIISKTSPISQMLFYYFLVSTLIAGAMTLTEWHTPTTLAAWSLLFAIGLFGTAYQIFATLAYTLAPVRLMSPLVFLMVLFGGIFDWLIWGYVPTVLTLLGSALIIIGAIITIYFGQKQIKPSAPSITH